jgi:predicted ATP-grasp superfamily ATP-dependent carboligase
MSQLPLNHPWFVAVWPGMGHVAVSAGFYLISKLGMHLHKEVSAEGLFDIDHIEVIEGIIQPTEMPRNRYFIYRDPQGKRDGVVFLGEAQPSQHKYQFCSDIIAYAKQLGVTEITTFAAMASSMRPEHKSRVFAAATDEATLDGFIQLEAEVLKEGHISGLNGILLGAASTLELHGACFLGEMPSIFHQFPYPKASLNVLRIFCQSVGLTLDTQELEEQAKTMDEQLSKWLRRLERSIQQQREGETESDDEGLGEADGDSDETKQEEFHLGDIPGGGEPNQLSPQDEEKIETLFEAASTDRAKAYELKRELDRLQVFKQYENRFLDLFRQPPPMDHAA